MRGLQDSASTRDRLRLAFRVGGVVQGVGFRPFVYGLAHDLELSGFVGNDGAGVFIEVEGSAAQLDSFRQRLITDAPPLAQVESFAVENLTLSKDEGFRIVESDTASGGRTLISPDLAICDDCLRELRDPADRRYRYPFINCTNCGPRFSITRALPYDRPYTTMASFELCPECQAEYDNPLDRRYHAQPVCCPACGPQVFWLDSKQLDTQLDAKDAMQQAIDAVRAGQIVAIKGLGGFHLACDARNEIAVRTLRQRKGRPFKPLAVMMRDAEIAAAYVDVDAYTRGLLSSRESPILLLPRRETDLAASVAPNIAQIGIMLPYTPLHILLMDALDTPLVMTSGNISGEPIIIDNATALSKLGHIVDGFLMHNRDIHVPCDDSVIQIISEGESPIRRSRGYAPLPVRLGLDVPAMLAVGGELKNTFALAEGRYAFMSQHIGDMENIATLSAFDASLQQLSDIFGIKPELVVSDMHPGYLSTRRAEELAARWSVPHVKIQHHEAHIAAVMAEHQIDTPVISFAFDGTGYGKDGTIWGGEIFTGDCSGFTRVAHLDTVPLPGGDAAVRHPSRIALAHLWAAGIAWDADLPPVQHTPASEQRIIRRQLDSGLNTVQTSSMGRLFDAVSSLIGICHDTTYEGQAAIELEAATYSEPSSQSGDEYQFKIDVTNGMLVINPGSVITRLIQDVRAQYPASLTSARFHGAVAAMMLDIAQSLRQWSEINTVVLSGGVFQNTQLTQDAITRLQQADFQVLTHHIVPANDAGIALGQIAIAAAQLNPEKS